MAGVEVVMTSQEAALWAGVMRVAKGFDGMAESIRKASKADKELEAQNKNLESAAKRVFESTRTPLEQHNAKLKELGVLLEKGKINQETFGRAVKNSEGEMQRLESASKSAFGREAIGNVVSFASSLGLIVGPLAAARHAIEEIKRMKEEAAAEARTTEFDWGSLAQLTSDPKKYLELRKKAQDIFKTGGSASQSEAIKLVFMMQSTGAASEDLAYFAELRKKGVLAEPGEMAARAKTIQAAMGRKETGPLRKIVDKALAASEGMQFRAEELIPAAAKAGQFGSYLKFTDEEILTATSKLAEISGPDVAGTQMRSLASALFQIQAGGVGESESGIQDTAAIRQLREKIRKISGGRQLDLVGKNLIEQVREIQRLNLDPASLQKLFGRKEAMAAFSSLAQSDVDYEALLQRVNEANRMDVGMIRAKLPDLAVSTAAARGNRIAGQEQKVSDEDLGTTQNIRDMLYTLRATQIRERQGLTGTVLNAASSWLFDWTMTTKGFAKEALSYAQGPESEDVYGLHGKEDVQSLLRAFIDDQKVNQDLLRKLNEELQGIRKSNEGVEKNTAAVEKNSRGSAGRAAAEDRRTHEER
jgi:hypothetical protein